MRGGLLIRESTVPVLSKHGKCLPPLWLIARNVSIFCSIMLQNLCQLTELKKKSHV